MPPPKPVSAPLLPITRWHGTTIGIAFAPFASPPTSSPREAPAEQQRGVGAPRPPRVGAAQQLRVCDAARRFAQAEVGVRERVGIAAAHADIAEGPGADAAHAVERAGGTGHV